MVEDIGVSNRQQRRIKMRDFKREYDPNFVGRGRDVQWLGERVSLLGRRPFFVKRHGTDGIVSP